VSGTNDICGTCGLLIVHRIDCPEHALRKDAQALAALLADLHARVCRGDHGSGRANADCVVSAIVTMRIDHAGEIEALRAQVAALVLERDAARADQHTTAVMNARLAAAQGHPWCAHCQAGGHETDAHAHPDEVSELEAARAVVEAARTLIVHQGFHAGSRSKAAQADRTKALLALSDAIQAWGAGSAEPGGRGRAGA